MRYALPPFLAAAAALMLAAPGVARAQQHHQNGSEALHLPTWSAPQPDRDMMGPLSLSAPSKNLYERLPEEARTGRRPPAPVREEATPPPPLLPDPVPLGGLEWLALAGGAYAVNRLRRRDGEDDASDDGDTLP